MVAKAAASAYLDCVDAEYREKGVKVNQILPSMFRSLLLKNLPEYIVDTSISNGIGGPFSELSPDGDVASLIVYLLSPAGVNGRSQKIVLGD